MWEKSMPSLRVTTIIVVCFAAFASIGAPRVEAHEYKVGSLVIGHPWTRATPGGAKVAGGYMSITNNGKTADRLIGGSLTQAAHVEIHQMKMEGTMMRMRPLANGLEIKPHDAVTLAPGGYHMMFMGLKGPLKQGERVKGTLKFEKAGTINVEFVVEGVGAKRGGSHGGHGDGHGGSH